MTQLSNVRIYQKRNKNSLPGSGLILTLRNAVRYLTGKASFVKQVNRERRALSHLSDYHLRDIGLTRDQVNDEIKRGIFDTPSAHLGEFGFQRTRFPDRESPKLRQIPKD